MRFFIFVLTIFAAQSAFAVDIQKVISPKYKIEAWLVESSQLPMVNVQVAFRAGSVYDENKKAGLSAFTAHMIPEGSGSMNASEFTQAVEEVGALFSAQPGLLSSTYSMRMLSEHKEKSFDLLGQALTWPRFDEDAFQRVKGQMQTSIRKSSQSPGHVANEILKAHLYESHPYGRPSSGTLESLENIELKDIQKFYSENYTRQNMLVSVVGDIKPDELGQKLDILFNSMPKGVKVNSLQEKTIEFTPKLIRHEMNVPQSTVYLAAPAITRDDPDYYAAYAMNYVLGGGGFNSRFMSEIREKRGLAYGVYSYLEPLPSTGSFIASVSTKNEDVHESISLMKAEMAHLKKQGITDEEYKGAMAYLVGSFPLRFDSSSKILGYLTTMQLEGLGMDYLDMWPKRIAAVSKADMELVAKRLLDEKSMLTVIVGGDK